MLVGKGIFNGNLHNFWILCSRFTGTKCWLHLTLEKNHFLTCKKQIKKDLAILRIPYFNQRDCVNSSSATFWSFIWPPLLASVRKFCWAFFDHLAMCMYYEHSPLHQKLLNHWSFIIPPKQKILKPMFTISKTELIRCACSLKM